MNQLQLIYAASQIDALRMYDRFEITEQVTNQKKQEQLFLGKQKAAQLQIHSIEDTFTKLTSLFGCANWEVEKTDTIQTAKTATCALCAIAKKMSTSSPCNLFCLDPMEGIVKGFNNNATFTVKQTLWNSDACVVTVKE